MSKNGGNPPTVGARRRAGQSVGGAAGVLREGINAKATTPLESRSTAEHARRRDLLDAVFNRKGRALRPRGWIRTALLFEKLLQLG